jgi:hypothetical protein
MIGNQGNTQVQGIPHFVGADKPRGACEALYLQRVPQDVRAFEADLYVTKWFDYRRWHPMTATYYWVHCYIEAARRFCAQNNDIEKAEQLKIFGVEDIGSSRDLIAAITARQNLDRIGCRYEWALTWMIKRHSDRGWMAFPRPNQLYGEELMLDVRDAWVEECAVSLQIPRSSYFKAGQGDVCREFTDWAFDQVRRRTVDHWRPLSRLLREGVVTPQQVQEAFGHRTAERAIRVSK